MRKIFTRKDQKSKRRQLRNDLPKAEVVLWSKLKGKQLLGLKFRRQHSIEQYVMNSYCPEIGLDIEIDGRSHYEPEAEAHDAKRRALIESYGIRVLRFTNTQVYENLPEVWQEIEETAARLKAQSAQHGVQRANPPVSPLEKGGSSPSPYLPLGRGDRTPLSPPLGRGE